MKYSKESNIKNNYKENIRNLIRRHIKRILIIGNERKKNQKIINNNNNDYSNNNDHSNHDINDYYNYYHNSNYSNNYQDLTNEKFSKIASYIENLLFFQSANFNEYSNIETLQYRLRKLALQYYQIDDCECKDYPTQENNNHSNINNTNDNDDNNVNENNNDNNNFSNNNTTNLKKKIYSLTDPVFICLPFNLKETSEEEFSHISKFSISNSRVFQAEFQYQS